jgi:hypothetical protein
MCRCDALMGQVGVSARQDEPLLCLRGRSELDERALCKQSREGKGATREKSGKYYGTWLMDCQKHLAEQ